MSLVTQVTHQAHLQPKISAEDKNYFCVISSPMQKVLCTGMAISGNEMFYKA
jgi:hypothetical protein